MSGHELFFEVFTPLEFHVRVTRSYWNVIARVKHPLMNNQENRVQETLKDPDEVRQSRRDNKVYLFYKCVNPKRWTCAVVKRLNGAGFLITAYPADAIKEGDRIWPK